MNEPNFAAVLITAVLVGAITAIISTLATDAGWVQDCTKLGGHVTIAGQIVKCERPK